MSGNIRLLERDKIKRYTHQPVRLIQAKVDGHWAEVYKVGGVATILGKKQEIDSAPKLLEHPVIAPALAKMPDNTMFMGEFHCPGVHATSVPTMINECDPKLQLTPFAVRDWRGEDARHWSWIKAQVAMHSLGLEPVATWRCFNETRSLSMDEVAQLKEDAKKEGFEGFVLKGRHFFDWYKLKPTWTVDAAVSSTTVSDSDQHFGGLKAIQVSLWSPVLQKWMEVASVGSGFEASYRAIVDRSSLLNKVAEVEYEGRAANGRLKFPRFIRWRDDKPVAECTIDQLPRAINVC